MRGSAGIRQYAVGLAIILWIMTASSGFAQQNQDVTTVFTIGSSRIVGNDMSRSRQQAIADGLAAAAYQVLAEFLPEEVFSTGFQALNESIFSRTDHFVNNYKVLTESVHGKSYRLLIRAGISVQRIKETLKSAGIWVDQQQLPRVLLCVAEKMVEEIDFHYWWSSQPMAERNISTTVLARQLVADQFILLPPAPGALSAGYPWNLNASEAVALGRIFEADVVVTGVANAEAAPNTMGGNLRSFRGTISLTAYRVSDGEQISLTHRSVLSAAQKSIDGGREALSNAASQAGAELSLMIQEAWRSKGAGNFQLELFVEGTGGNMASFVKLRGALSVMSGVDSIQLKEMTTADAVLLVAYQGNARSLADALLVHQFDTFGINISEVGLNHIRLHLTAP